MSTILRQSSPMTNPTYLDTGVWNQANAQTVEMRRSHEDTDTDQRLGPYTAKAIHGGGPVALGCAALVLPPCKQSHRFSN
jgi:hypothetical protein